MAITLGTNSGFVKISPTTDPKGTAFSIDNVAMALIDTTPIGNFTYRINEIGWWNGNNNQDVNFEVGIYADSGGSPGDLLYVDRTNAKGVDIGWIKSTPLNFDLEGNTLYWITVQLDDTTNPTSTDRELSGGNGWKSDVLVSTMPEPFVVGSLDSDGKMSIYARYEEILKPGTSGSRTIATNYPVEEGLIAHTTKQTSNPNLIAIEGSR